MADFAQALKARLAAYAPLTALTGASKIHWVKVPQATALPYIRLQVVSDPRPEHLQGYDDARVTRVQADCMAASWGLARDMAEKIIAAVATPGTTSGVHFGRIKAEGPQDLGEDTAAGYVFRASLDLLVEHKLA